MAYSLWPDDVREKDSWPLTTNGLWHEQSESCLSCDMLSAIRHMLFVFWTRWAAGGAEARCITARPNAQLPDWAILATRFCPNGSSASG